MKARRTLSAFLGFILTAAFAVAQPGSDAEIRKILADRVGAENRGIAIVAGIIDANGRRIVSYGSVAKDDKRRLDGDTVFEIGSVSKVFTSLLLMDMVRKGEVALNDPISKYLPSTVKVPERNNHQITLADLSTQSSGLPGMPGNFNPKDRENPYADYSVQQMYDFLSGYTLTRDIGSQFEYSNLGVGLLGHVLTLRAGKSYEELVRSRICDPLGMKDTRVTLTPDMKARLAVGHNEAGNPAANWDIPTLAGAGALRSTTNDMLIFLAANLGYTKTPLAQAMADEISIRRPTGQPGMEIAYNWLVQTKDGNSIIWHNGGTGGYRTYMGFDPKARVGVVVLSNIDTQAGPDDIGRHLLDASYPLVQVKPPSEHTEITLDTKTFDRYVGVYQLAPSMLLTMSRDGATLYTQLTGQPKFPVFAESDHKFFLKVVDAQLTFDVDAQGAPTQVTLHQNGRDTVAKRLTDAEAKSAQEAIDVRNAEVAKRAKAQTPAPGTEAALRRTIKELQTGEPNYDLMVPAFAAVTRQQLPQMKAEIGQWGALQSVTFKRVDPQSGADVYSVKFANASSEWGIILSADGKTAGMIFRPE